MEGKGSCWKRLFTRFNIVLITGGLLIILYNEISHDSRKVAVPFKLELTTSCPNHNEEDYVDHIRGSKIPLATENATNLKGSSLRTVLMERVRTQLTERAEQFMDTPLREYNRSHLPRKLKMLGNAIFRIVPETFLEGYRSPCFQLPTHDEDLACLPYFFVAGFPKCATTDLYSKLIRHPDVESTPKEPHWWTRSSFSKTSVYHYLSHQNNLTRILVRHQNQNLVTLDASPSTIWDNTFAVRKCGVLNQPPPYTVADILRVILPNTKIVIIVRNPTERLYSGYMAFDDEWKETKSPRDFHRRLVSSVEDFSRCMSWYTLRTCANVILPVRLNVGMYSVFIRDWLERFPRDQIIVLRTEDWAADPTNYLKTIFEFLDLDPLTPSTRNDMSMASKKNPRSDADKSLGPMLDESRHILNELYRPFNRDLARLLSDNRYLWES